MQLMDSSPERRNLIVFSLVIILYIVGEGKVDSVISLPFTSIKLTNTENVITSFWLIFLYVNFRYFLVFKDSVYVGSKLHRERIEPKDWISSTSIAIIETIAEDLKKRENLWVRKGNIGGNIKDLRQEIKSKSSNPDLSKVQLRYSYQEQTKRFVLHASFNGYPIAESNPESLFSFGLPSVIKGFFVSVVKNSYITSWYMPWALSLLAIGLAL